MWFSLAVLGYFFLALSAFLDKYILGETVPSPKVYAFYTGIMAISAVALIPIEVVIPSLDMFFVPSLPLIGLSFATGIILVGALFVYYKGVFEFEVSRISPIVGGIVPLVILLLVYLISSLPIELIGIGIEKETLTLEELIALALLVLGIFILALQKNKRTTLRSLEISIVAALLFGLSFLLIKVVYTLLSFWPGFIWIGIGQSVGALFFILSSEVRREVFRKKGFLNKKVASTFLLAKGAASVGSILQSRAVFVAPLLLLPIVNALSGVQHVFLIILATIFFFKFPKIFKEQISKGVIIQKTVAIWLIVMGLAFLALN